MNSNHAASMANGKRLQTPFSWQTRRIGSSRTILRKFGTWWVCYIAMKTCRYPNRQEAGGGGPVDHVADYGCCLLRFLKASIHSLIQSDLRFIRVLFETSTKSILCGEIGSSRFSTFFLHLWRVTRALCHPSGCLLTASRKFGRRRVILFPRSW